MNADGVDEVAGPVVLMKPMILQDPIITPVVFQVFEIQKSSDYEKWDDLNTMLQMVCKKFKKVVFDYNRTPRYALAANYNTIQDILADFKDSHLAKMLRELGLMQYWDRFKNDHMYSFANNVKYLEIDMRWYVRDEAHHALIVQYITREVAAHGGR
jgi:hypothetical protein